MCPITRRDFLRYSSTGFLAASAACRTTPLLKKKAPRPHFVFMMTDDQRWDGMGCAGNPVLKTPNMDRIAGEGVRFSNMFVTTSLCGPSRATNLTGKYAHLHGVRRNGLALPPDQPTFPEILKEAGYETAFIGKWHNRDQAEGRNFDYTFMFKGQGRYENPVIAENFGPGREYAGHVTDILTDAAVRFLKYRDRQKPFCLCLWFKAPHRSWHPPERVKNLFNDAEMPVPANYNDDYRGRPEAVRNADMRIGDFDDVPDLNTFLRRYYACLAAVDENVGRVLDALKDLGYEKDTVVLYSGDNGFFLGEHHFFDKRLMYEESIRVPLLVKYPRLVTPGTTDSRMVLNIDVAPTLLDLAGLPVPAGMNGRSIKPLLKNQKAAWRQDFLYEYYEYPAVHMVRKHRGVRTERWKYIHYFEEPEEFELYDLKNDSHEMNNLASRPGYEEVKLRLQARLLELRKENRDPDLEG